MIMLRIIKDWKLLRGFWGKMIIQSDQVFEKIILTVMQRTEQTREGKNRVDHYEDYYRKSPRETQVELGLGGLTDEQKDRDRPNIYFRT